MLTGILLTIFVGLVWGFSGVLFSYVAREKIEITTYFVSMHFFMAILFAAFYAKWPLVLAGSAPRLAELVVVMGTTAIINMLAFLAMNRAFRLGHHGLTWTIGQSAMVIPFVASILIWQNRVPFQGYLGVGLVLATLVLLGLKKEESGHVDRRWWLPFIMLSFIGNGIAQTLSTTPSRWPEWQDAANMRVMIFSSVSFLMALTLVIIRRAVIVKKAVLLGLAGGLMFVFSQAAFYRSMDSLERCGMISLVYPLAVGVCIVSFALYSWLGLKERFGIKELIGVVLGVMGIGFMAWK